LKFKYPRGRQEKPRPELWAKLWAADEIFARHPAKAGSEPTRKMATFSLIRSADMLRISAILGEHFNYRYIAESTISPKIFKINKD